MQTYTKTNWQNEPSSSTPLSAENLNKIENCLGVLTTPNSFTLTLPSGVTGFMQGNSIGPVVALRGALSGTLGADNQVIMNIAPYNPLVIATQLVMSGTDVVEMDILSNGDLFIRKPSGYEYSFTFTLNYVMKG